MQQSNVIFAALLFAYILFITNKGELPLYIQLLRGGGKLGKQQGSAGAGGTGAGDILGQANSLIDSAGNLVFGENASSIEKTFGTGLGGLF